MLSRLTDERQQVDEILLVVLARPGVLDCLPRHDQPEEGEAVQPQTAEVLVSALERERAADEGHGAVIEKRLAAILGDGEMTRSHRGRPRGLLARAAEVHTSQQQRAAVLVDEAVSRDANLALLGQLGLLVRAQLAISFHRVHPRAQVACECDAGEHEGHPEETRGAQKEGAGGTRSGEQKADQHLGRAHREPERELARSHHLGRRGARSGSTMGLSRSMGAHALSGRRREHELLRDLWHLGETCSRRRSDNRLVARSALWGMHSVCDRSEKAPFRLLLFAVDQDGIVGHRIIEVDLEDLDGDHGVVARAMEAFRVDGEDVRHATVRPLKSKSAVSSAVNRNLPQFRKLPEEFAHVAKIGARRCNCCEIYL